jgi:phage terminase large subunit
MNVPKQSVIQPLIRKTANITIPRGAFNPAYSPFFKSLSREDHLVGGSGSGKSDAVAEYLILCMLKAGMNERIPLVRKVARTIRRSQFQTIRDVAERWDMGKIFDFNTSDLEIRCKLTGSYAFALGLDDPEKIKSIAGLTKVWCEEATELNEMDRHQLNLRLRGKTKALKKLILSFNPIDEHHHLKTRVHDNALLRVPRKPGLPPRVFVLHTTYKDNRFLDPEYALELEELAQLDPTLYKIYALGLWATLKGIIFDNWQTTDDFPNKYDERIFGLDFGYTNQTALVEIRRVERTLYIRQLLYESGLLTSNIIAFMQGSQSDRFGEFIPTKIDSNDFIYADAAEPDRIQQIYDAGFNVIPANKDVKAGILSVKEYPILVDIASEDLLKERRSYKFAEDKNGNPLEVPVAKNNHLMDAIRYGIHTHSLEYWGHTSTAVANIASKIRNRQPKFYEGYSNGALTGFMDQRKRIR